MLRESTRPPTNKPDSKRVVLITPCHQTTLALTWKEKVAAGKCNKPLIVHAL